MSVKFIKNIVRVKKKNENEFKQIGAFGFKDEDAEAIRSDLSDLEDVVDTKVGYSEVAGNQLKMYRDSSKTVLLATLDLPVTQPTDVQINGTSITSDGVANIPYANLNGHGVIKTTSTSGIYVGSTGVASIDYATASGIDDTRYRSGTAQYSRPIVPKNLDYAVKAAMCDGIGADWTDAEKLSARQRMGLGGNWELIEDITVGEDTDVINRTAEPNGTLYDFIGLLIVFCATTVTGGVIYSYVNNNVNTQSYLTVTNNTMQYTRAVHKIDNGVITTTYHEMGVSSVGQASTIKERNYPLLFADKINAVKIGASGKIATGSNIKIYGIRA